MTHGKKYLLGCGFILGLIFLIYTSPNILVPFWPVYCKRCGCGQIGVTAYSVLVGAGGNYLLFCETKGHAWTFGLHRKIILRDWWFQRESYRTEAEYLEELKHQEATEALMRDSGKSSD